MTCVANRSAVTVAIALALLATGAVVSPAVSSAARACLTNRAARL